eukprot:3496308-Pyramimonas_sp.AAC.2
MREGLGLVGGGIREVAGVLVSVSDDETCTTNRWDWKERLTSGADMIACSSGNSTGTTCIPTKTAYSADGNNVTT